MTTRVTFVCAAAISLSRLASVYAADPLEQWGRRTAPGSGYGLNAVAFGNGVFVAVGGNGTTLVSSDGANWTNTNPGNYGELRNVHFLNGEFNVVGNTNRLLRSTDGVSWTVSILPPGNYWDVAYGNGVRIVVGQSISASIDDVNWIPAAPFIPGSPGLPPRFVRFDCVSFGAGEFVAMPRDVFYPQEQGVFHSTDGTNWILTSGPYQSGHLSSLPPSEMIYADELFVIANVRNGGIHTSSNGVTWDGANFGNSQSPPGGITYGANYFVSLRNLALPPSVSLGFFSSTNAISWQQRYPQPGFAGPQFEPTGVAFGNGAFVAVGHSNSEPVIFQSGHLSGAPAILTEPLDRAAVVGNPASFSVTAGGADPLAYQWQKDGVAIGDATNSTFTITNVAATNAGGYRVVVTNLFGSVTSRVGQLTVSFLEIHNYAGITILGVPGKTYRVEASPQAGGSWSVLTNLVLPKTPYVWIDYESPNVEARVYRVAELQ